MTDLFRNSFQMWDFGTGAAMSSLYELTILFITFTNKQKAKAEAAEAADND